MSEGQRDLRSYLGPLEYQKQHSLELGLAKMTKLSLIKTVGRGLWKHDHGPWFEPWTIVLSMLFSFSNL